MKGGKEAEREEGRKEGGREGRRERNKDGLLEGSRTDRQATNTQGPCKVTNSGCIAPIPCASVSKLHGSFGSSTLIRGTTK
jgi:hypothetical protein